MVDHPGGTAIGVHTKRYHGMGRPAAIAIVALVLLAGCQTAGSGTPTRSLTPPPVPDVTPTPSTGLRLPPGVASTGVASPSLLVAAHREALADRSYALRLRYVERFANGTERAAVTWRNTYEVDGTARTIRVQNFSNIGLANYSADTWSNGRVVVSRIAIDGDVRYFRPAEIPYSLTGGRQLFVVLARGEFDVTWVPDRGAYRLRMTAFEGTRPLVRSYTFTPEVREDLRNITLTMLITPAGLVREYRLAYHTTVDGSTVHVVESIRFEDLGEVAVERPAWVEEALARTNETG